MMLSLWYMLPREFLHPCVVVLKKELNRMTTMGVIRKDKEPTDWVNSMVCVKNNDLRVCTDPKDLNENIKRENYQIPK